MKKIYKISAIFIALFSVTAMMNAQTWPAPVYKSEVPVSGTAYYIFNVGSNGFLNRGGYWGTQAIVSSTPRANSSVNINKWTSVNTTGSTWTFQYNNNGSNVANNYMFDTGGGTDLYTDNSTNNGFTVTETDVTNHIFTIQSPLSAANYIGSALATESTNKGIANIVRPNRSTVDDYVKWKFVSQANYDLYQAKVLLDRYMTYAKEKGGITLTSYITTYNSDVTADINTASASLLTALGRTDLTASITNPSFESTLTGWTNTGSFVTQTNTPGQGWTKAGTTYVEKYIAGSSNLAAGALTQTITGLSNGIYELVASAHAIQQGGSNPLHTNAFIKCGSASTEVSAGMDYTVANVLVTSGSLTVGYALEGSPAANWTGIDNFRLYYYGPSAVLNTDATLSDLKIGDGLLIPSFSVSNTSYTVTLPTTATTVNVNATKSDAKASFTINGTAASNTVNQAVALTAGSGTATIVVTAEDGTTTKTYTINFVGVSSTKKHSYTFDDGTANDKVGTANGTTNGAKIAIANGAATVSAATASTDGYISLPAASLALQGYSSITMEAYLKAGTTNGSFSMLAYFGNNTGGDKSFWFQPTINGTASRAAINNTSPLASSSVELNDGNYHHVVAVLTPTELDYYLDGTLAASTSTGATNYITTIDTQVANLFKGPDGWADPDYNASLYEFNLYEGVLASSEIASKSAAFVGKAHDASLSGITVNGTALSNFSAGTYTYEVKLNPGSPVPTVVATKTDANASVVLTNATAIPGSTTITTTAEDGKTMITYTLNFVTTSADATLSGITINSGALSLIPAFASGTKSYVVAVPNGATSVEVGATKSNASATINSGTGTINLTGGVATTSIVITAEDGTTQQTYTIKFKAENFTPLYSTRTNLITDPTITSLSNFGGWGGISVNTNPDYSYGGVTSAKVTGKCGGSLDYNLASIIQGSKTYRVKAMVSTNGTGEVKIGIAGATATNILQPISTAAGQWLPIDFYFTTQATPSAPNMYFNSCESQTATESYIDNWEMYDITDLTTGLAASGDNKFNVYTTDKKIVANFTLAQSTVVELSIYNTQGMLLSKEKSFCSEGSNQVILNSNLKSGVYIVKASIDGKFSISKILL